MGAVAKFLTQLSSVSLLTLLSRLLGFCRESIQIACLGVNKISDAYTAAMMLPSIIRKLTSEGLFNSAFIPIYHNIDKQHGKKEADIWASNILFMIIIYSTILLILVEMFLPIVLSVFFSGFLKKTTWGLLNKLASIIFISIVGSSISSFINTIWVSKRNFFLATIGSSVCNVVIIAGSLLSRNVYELSIATMLGTYVQCAVTIFPLRHNIYYQLSKQKTHTKHFIRLLIPLGLSALLLQYLMIISAWFGSWLQNGHLTYFSKADKLILLPISLIGVTLNTVLIPTLISKKHIGYTTLSAQIGIALSCFICAMILLFSNDIAYIAFGYGKMTSTDIHNIASVLLIYSFGLPAWILIKIWHASLASAHNTKIALIGNIIHVISYASIGLLFIQKIDMYILSIASVISVWINFLFVTYHIIKLKLIHKNTYIFSIIMLFTTVFTVFNVQNFFTYLPKMHAFLNLVVGSIMTGIIFFITITFSKKFLIKSFNKSVNKKLQ